MMPNSAPPGQRLSLPYAGTATALITLGGVVLFGALDIASSNSSMGGEAAFSALTFWFVGGIAAGALLGLGVLPVVWPLRSMLSRPQFVGILTGLALQIVVVVSFSRMAVVAALPLAWLLATVLSRVEKLQYLSHLSTLCVALLVTSLVTTAVITAWHPRPTIALVLAGVLVPAGILIAQRLSLRRAGWTLAALAATFVLITLAMVAQPASDPASRVLAKPDRHGAPNVVLIVLDTTRRDHLGAYGSTEGLTPNFDRLAREATLYQAAISPADWTVPSHASLFTGLYPATHGTSFAHHRWLDDRFVTLAEMLKLEGYQTAGLVANRYIGTANLNQGLDHYVQVWDAEDMSISLTAKVLGVPRRWVDKGATRAAASLEEFLHGAYDPSKPLYLFVNLLEPHWRYLPPWKERLAHLPPGVGYLAATRTSLGFFPVNWLAGQRSTPEEIRTIRALYAGEVSYLDDQLGRLLAVLRDALDLDNTVLIITADHGENLGEGGRWDHVFAVDDHVVRVPLIIRYPKRFPPGLRISGQCQTIDLVPTVFDVIGHGTPVADLPGRSIVPDAFRPRTETFIESVPYYDHMAAITSTAGLRRDTGRFTHVQRAIRTEQYKFVWSAGGQEALYDLHDDPDETVDVLPQHRDVADALRNHLSTWWDTVQKYQAPSAAPAATDSVPALSPAERERLRQLGYLP